MERVLTRDWTGRLYAIFKVREGGSSRQRACSEVGLRRLLLGEEGVHLDENISGITEVKNVFHNALRSTFRKQVLDIMSKTGHTSLPHARRVLWRVNEREKVKDTLVNTTDSMYKKGRNLLIGLYGLRHGYEGSQLQCYEAARRVTTDLYEGQRPTYLYNEVRSGSVVSVASRTVGDIVREEDSGTGTLRAYAVVSVMRGPDGKLWVISRPMRQVRGHEGLGMAASAEKCVVVELCKSVRRAGASHICDDGCKPDHQSLRVTHSKGVLDGGLYEIWTRKSSYPPHMA